MGPEINNNISFPAVLGLVVGLETCEEAKRNLTSYVCEDNSGCVDSTNGPGYNCYCNPGYEGNPYFANGCQGITECLSGKLIEDFYKASQPSNDEVWLHY
ncbi:hypothetical protein GIB67_013540 [Kingdonia uniflora]|uniref:Uncharacterized protein n=1 Tax=Kingdonia uniflora TaxID=39325 RepID=A0A7J7KUV1_9MAGN|nr:hypothetical protein GIB67_013540 [Kingdonia uniflora]